jgi:hypothetical protein
VFLQELVCDFIGFQRKVVIVVEDIRPQVLLAHDEPYKIQELLFVFTRKGERARLHLFRGTLTPYYILEILCIKKYENGCVQLFCSRIILFNLENKAVREFVAVVHNNYFIENCI